jgi:hypothetical protein
MVFWTQLSALALLLSASIGTGLPPTLIGIGVQKAGSTSLFHYVKSFSWIGRLVNRRGKYVAM